MHTLVYAKRLLAVEILLHCVISTTKSSFFWRRYLLLAMLFAPLFFYSALKIHIAHAKFQSYHLSYKSFHFNSYFF